MVVGVIARQFIILNNKTTSESGTKARFADGDAAPLTTYSLKLDNGPMILNLDALIVTFDSLLTPLGSNQ